MTSAAMLGIDTCPMEGIVPEKYDELLGLPSKGYATVVVGCAGYRAADDKSATIPKVRFHRDDLIETI
jgi:nitroreductase